MHNKNFNMVLISIILSFLLFSCVSPAKRVSNISTQKVPDYQLTAKRLVVVSSVGLIFGSEFADAFHRKLEKAVNQSGTEIWIIKVQGAESDKQMYPGIVDDFQADSLLVIEKTESTRIEYSNSTFRIRYLAKLVDLSIDKTIWRANIDFSRTNYNIPVQERGQGLAVELVNKLKQASILDGDLLHYRGNSGFFVN
jgi:hypothetical protein